MKKYLTPDFDVSVYELADKITADGSLQIEETTAAGDEDWFDQ